MEGLLWYAGNPLLPGVRLLTAPNTATITRVTRARCVTTTQVAVVKILLHLTIRGGYPRLSHRVMVNAIVPSPGSLYLDHRDIRDY